MPFVFQVCLVLILTIPVYAEGDFKFKPPLVRESLLGEGVGMLDRERDEYATGLATYVGNFIAAQKASEESLEFARRALALSLHLSPRNKRALVLSFQLGKGIMPVKVESQYSAESLAHLFLTRAEILFQQKGEPNKLLSRCFIEMAAILDPRNEDAVYAFQLQQINHGVIPWKDFTDGQLAK